MTVMPRALIVASVALAGCYSTTPGIRADPRGAGSVAELEWVALGGARQAVLIRGADSSKSIVLFLHGGPGMPTMFLAHAFQRDLERAFVVVQWDRRGAGKSYSAREPVESLTVRRTLEDLYELTRQLHDRFHGAPIYLVAHSWGTYLGLQAVHEHPELYRGYVGMGQMTGDTLREHAEQRRCVLAEVAANPDTVLRERIRARYGVASARVTEDDLFATRTEVRRATSVWPIIRTGLRAPEYSLVDGFHLQKGAQFVGQHMRYDESDEWMRTSPVLQIPVAFFLGRHDCNTPSSLAAEFLNRIDAPLKRLVWFDSSAHFPFWEESQRFTTAMVEFDSVVSDRRNAGRERLR